MDQQLDDVVAALRELLADGLVHTARGHWQLTASGYRAGRAYDGPVAA